MVSAGNEERVIGQERRGHPCSKVTKNVAELCSCSSAFWRVELGNDETGYLAGVISDSFSIDSVEGAAWLLLTAYNKM